MRIEIELISDGTPEPSAEALKIVAEAQAAIAALPEVQRLAKVRGQMTALQDELRKCGEAMADNKRLQEAALEGTTCATIVETRQGAEQLVWREKSIREAMAALQPKLNEAQRAADSAAVRVGAEHRGNYHPGQRAATVNDAGKIAEKIAALLDKLAQREVDRHHVESRLGDGVLVSARTPPRPTPELATAS
jgi:hypothetical protein